MVAWPLCRSPDELFDASVQEMSRRITDLARKNKPKLPPTKIPTQQAEHVDETLPVQPTPSPALGNNESPPSPPPLHSPSREPTPNPPTLTPTPPPQPPLPESTPSPPPPVVRVATPPPERVDTPLQTTLLKALQSKDLGSTGFVTRNELSSILTQLSKGKVVSSKYF